MTGDALAILDQRQRMMMVRATAAQDGMADDQVERLLDSNRFHEALSAIVVDAPDFTQRVTELVRSMASAPAASQGSGEPSQWTLNRVEDATPSQVAAAARDGLLRNLGIGGRRKRR